MKTLSLLLVSALLSSCAGTSVPPGKKPPPIKPVAVIPITSATATWNDLDDVRRAVRGKPVRLSGNTDR